MPLESKLEVAHSIEERCNVFADVDRPPCPYRAMPGTTRCQRHNGPIQEIQYQKAENRSYNLARWRADLERFGDSPTLKSLREEIAISRITLEAIVNKCQDQFDLAMHSPKISLMLSQTEKLVVSCNRLESRLGLVLDKSAVINLAEEIVQIVAGHVDEDTLSLVAFKIQKAVEDSGNVSLKEAQ